MEHRSSRVRGLSTEEVTAERKSNASTGGVKEWKPVSCNRELGERRDKKSARMVRVRRRK
jgi:hypothetical protein